MNFENKAPRRLDRADGPAVAPGQEAVSTRQRGLIDTAMDATEAAAENVMKEIALLAETLEPVLKQDNPGTIGTAMPEKLAVTPEDSLAARRVHQQFEQLNQIALTIGALRARIQL